MTCLVQPLQQSIQHLQDFGGQHVAKSVQIVWVSVPLVILFFMVVVQ